MPKTYMITGTSTGFGKAIAEHALALGNNVLLTARQPDAVGDIVSRYPRTAHAVRLDVTNEAERRNAVSSALDRFGRIDVLVNNAGQGSLGAIEEFSSEQIRRQFEVNTFAVIEMTRSVLPVMRKQNSGHIVNITSIGGLVSIGSFALYCATKFAVEGFSEGLRDELKPLGIGVTIVEPGAFRTSFAGDANMRPEKSMVEYAGVVEPIREYLYGSHGNQPGDPEKAAKAILQAINSAEPPLRLVLGSDAYDLWKQRRERERTEFARWKKLGLDTAFDGAQVGKIGGGAQ